MASRRQEVTRLITKSIIELCKARLPLGQGLDIDGIICISPGEQDPEIVIKVHEHISNLGHSNSINNGMQMRYESNENGRFVADSETNQMQNQLMQHPTQEGFETVRQLMGHTKMARSLDINIDSPNRTNEDGESQSHGQPYNDSMQTIAASQQQERGYQCSECQFITKNFEELNWHNEVFHGKHGTCHICLKTYPHKESVPLHMGLRHTGHPGVTPLACIAIGDVGSQPQSSTDLRVEHNENTDQMINTDTSEHHQHLSESVGGSETEDSNIGRGNMNDFPMTPQSKNTAEESPICIQDEEGEEESAICIEDTEGTEEVQEPREGFPCDICSILLPTFKSLHQHNLNTHRIGKTCKLCLETFLQETALTRHIESHDMDLQTYTHYLPPETHVCLPECMARHGIIMMGRAAFAHKPGPYKTMLLGPSPQEASSPHTHTNLSQGPRLSYEQGILTLKGIERLANQSHHPQSKKIPQTGKQNKLQVPEQMEDNIHGSLPESEQESTKSSGNLKRKAFPEQGPRSKKRMETGDHNKRRVAKLKDEDIHCGICGIEEDIHGEVLLQHMCVQHEFHQVFLCQLCGALFPNRTAFINHRLSIHADVFLVAGREECKTCAVYFYKEELREHARECQLGKSMIVDPEKSKAVLLEQIFRSIGKNSSGESVECRGKPREERGCKDSKAVGFYTELPHCEVSLGERVDNWVKIEGSEEENCTSTEQAPSFSQDSSGPQWKVINVTPNIEQSAPTNNPEEPYPLFLVTSSAAGVNNESSISSAQDVGHSVAMQSISSSEGMEPEERSSLSSVQKTSDPITIQSMGQEEASSLLLGQQHNLECDICENENATLVCQTCGLQFCNDCDASFHKKGALQLHLRRPKRLCSKCESVTAAFFCEDCELDYCQPCQVTKHEKGALQKHKITHLKAADADSSEHQNAITKQNDGAQNDGSQKTTHREVQRLLQDAFMTNKLNPKLYEPSSSASHSVTCIPCKQDISLGKAYKRLSNLHAHIKTNSHENAVADWEDRQLAIRAHETDVSDSAPNKKQKIDQADEEKKGHWAVEEKKMRMAKLFENIQTEHGINTFQLRQTNYEILCSYCLKILKIFPGRGTLVNNIHNHIRSNEHKDKVKNMALIRPGTTDLL